MFCTNCGKESLGDVKFCASCGKEVVVAAASSALAAQDEVKIAYQDAGEKIRAQLKSYTKVSDDEMFCNNCGYKGLMGAEYAKKVNKEVKIAFLEMFAYSIAVLVGLFVVRPESDLLGLVIALVAIWRLTVAGNRLRKNLHRFICPSCKNSVSG